LLNCTLHEAAQSGSFFFFAGVLPLPFYACKNYLLVVILNQITLTGNFPQLPLDFAGEKMKGSIPKIPA
jgi:hypothetical protein